MMPQRFIGIMTGTSLDAIDIALVNIDAGHPTLVEYLEFPYPGHLRAQVVSLLEHAPNVNLDLMLSVHRSLGLAYADAALDALCRWQLQSQHITAIGSHGQTIWHQPAKPPGYTLQLGCGASIAVRTGIATVSDFRSADVAAGGEGAPLAPGFHATLARKETQPCAFLNLGGIANITLVPKGRDDDAVRGFDIGPANTLLDAWVQASRGERLDEDGLWARSGEVSPTLLQALREDPYFRRSAPKSTGREYFNLEWLRAHLQRHAALESADVQATLVELTASTVSDAISVAEPRIRRLYVCGGGAKNGFLMERIAVLSDVEVSSTTSLGVHPDAVEAATFAWLAERRITGQASNLRRVTGAEHRIPLGALYLPPTHSG